MQSAEQDFKVGWGCFKMQGFIFVNDRNFAKWLKREWLLILKRRLDVCRKMRSWFSLPMVLQMSYQQSSPLPPSIYCDVLQKIPVRPPGRGSPRLMNFSCQKNGKNLFQLLISYTFFIVHVYIFTFTCPVSLTCFLRPCIVYMLRDMDIMEDLNDIRKVSCSPFYSIANWSWCEQMS